MAAWSPIVTSIVTWLAGLYLGALALLSLAALLARRPELRGLLRTYLALACFPSVLLLPLGLAVAPGLLAPPLLLPLLGLTLAYGPLLTPRSPQSASDGTQLTVLTYNLQAAADTERMAGIAQAILRADIDVVGVQELSHSAATYLAAALHDRYPYQALHPQPNPHAGQGVFSRYPLASDQYWQHEIRPWTLGHQRVELDISSTRLVFYNAHPVPPFSWDQPFHLHPHSYDLRALLPRLESETGPLILVGDLNMTDRFDEYRLLAARLNDAYRMAGHVGLGFTFPHSRRWLLPTLARLDYVWYSSELRCTEARVLRWAKCSDHLPVRAHLVL